MRGGILWLILLIAPPVGAQQVSKCVKGRDVSYQSTPCDRSQSLAKQWEATPDRESAVVEARGRRAERRQEERESTQPRHAESQGWALSGNRVRVKSLINSADKKCDAAKAHREAKLNSMGLKRTFDLLRKLDAAVQNACKQ